MINTGNFFVDAILIFIVLTAGIFLSGGLLGFIIIYSDGKNERFNKKTKKIIRKRLKAKIENFKDY